MYEKKNQINDITKVSNLYNSLNDNKSKIIPFRIVSEYAGAGWSGKSPARLKLSNSGEALKLWLPLNGTKAICKWINNSLMVTTSKMMETEIGNRGSKSIIHTLVIIVNEQRVDDSWGKKHTNKGIYHQRCTLIGFERNSKVSSLSKKIHLSIGFSTKSRWGNKVWLPSDREISKLDPNWITGFVDGEGCFHVSITENKNLNVGWMVAPRFQISLHKRDEPVLQDVKISLIVGRIYERGPEAVQYVVGSLKELEAVINHFHKFPLITQKSQDFKLILMVNEIMRRKEHLTEDGLRKIVAIRASMNLGLSDVLKKAFPDVVSVTRPLVKNLKVQDPNWLAGFTSGEGCFMVKIQASKTITGYTVYLEFQLIQHNRDLNLITSLIKYLNCGYVIKKRTLVEFRVTKFDDITNKIIPFFIKYPIQGVKALDFEDWCKVAEMMKVKKHLTAEGLEKIKQIKAGMNKGRKLD